MSFFDHTKSTADEYFDITEKVSNPMPSINCASWEEEQTTDESVSLTQREGGFFYRYKIDLIEMLKRFLLILRPYFRSFQTAKTYVSKALTGHHK